jgi:N-acyl-D-amino-acid deacylase
MPEGDLTIRNGLIVDGTGAAPFRGDVEIRAGRVASLHATTAAAATGPGEIDATGCVVTPGFEDIPEVVMTDGLPWTWETDSRCTARPRLD